MFLAYEGLLATSTVMSGLNPVTETTGAATTATALDFGYPFSTSSDPSAKRRKVAGPVAPSSSTSGKSSQSKKQKDQDYIPGKEEEEDEDEPI